mgnify:CR=1 FL=1
MFDVEELKRRDEDIKKSEAVFHSKREQDMATDKSPDNYEPHWSERDGESRPRELFSMGNSYGNVSFAANRKKEMFLTVSQQRRHNSKALNNDHKKLIGTRRRQVPDAVGRALTNSFDPINSAFAFKTKKIPPTRRLLDSINKYVDKNGQNTVETILPFLNLEKDKKRRQALIDEIGRADKEGHELLALEQEKEQLSKAISRKEQMQSRFIKKTNFAVKKARVVTDERHITWFNNAILTEGIIPSDTPPDDEDDLTEGILNAIHNKAPMNKE